MMPNPPLPADDPTTNTDVPDLGRRDDLERSLDDGDADRSVPPEEERPETADEKRPEGLSERPSIEPDDATPTEDPGVSPI
jgi:hypothetical protein